MAKNPTLTVVAPAAPINAPPAALGEAGRKLWQSIHHDFVIDDAGGAEMLAQICLTADRAAECAAQIAADGAVIRTKNGMRDHPLLKHERAREALS